MVLFDYNMILSMRKKVFFRLLLSITVLILVCFTLFYVLVIQKSGTSKDISEATKTQQSEVGSSAELETEVGEGGMPNTVSTDSYGFRSSYIDDIESLSIRTTNGRLFKDDVLVDAPAETQYQQIALVDDSSRKVLLSIQGINYRTFTEGLSPYKLINDCNENKGAVCSKLINKNGSEYYSFDRLQYFVGELHVAVFELDSESALLITVHRIDSSELPSSEEEFENFTKLVDSIVIK